MNLDAHLQGNRPEREPGDSTLFLDCMRVMERLLRNAEAQAWPGLAWHNHMRQAKKRAQAIGYTWGQDNKRVLYRGLVSVTQATQEHLEQSVMQLDVRAGKDSLAWVSWQAEIKHFMPLIARVIDQTRRRVFAGEAVPSISRTFHPRANRKI